MTIRACLLIAFVTSSFLAFGCSSDKQLVVPDFDPILDAPEILEWEGLEIALTSELIRYFRPSDPTDGGPLEIRVTIRDLNGQLIPPSLSLVSVWVIYGADRWNGALSKLWSDGLLSQIEKYAWARGGPKLEPGTLVTVVAELVDSNGSRYWVRADDQEVKKVTE